MFNFIQKNAVYSVAMLLGTISISSYANNSNNNNISYYNPFAMQAYAPTPASAAPLLVSNLPSVSPNRLIPPQHFPFGRPNLSCVVQAAQRRNIPADVFLGVQSVERGETGQQMRNSNATYDMGAFQINTIHLPRIAQLGGSKDDVMRRGCFNAEVASLLLHEALTNPKKQSLDFYSRASGYHSWTPKYNQIYRQKLMKYTRQWQAWLKNNNMAHLVTSPRI